MKSNENMGFAIILNFLVRSYIVSLVWISFAPVEKVMGLSAWEMYGGQEIGRYLPMLGKKRFNQHVVKITPAI